MKKFKVLGWVAFAVAILGVVGYSSRGDIMALRGEGTLRSVEVFRINSTGDLTLTDSASYDALTIDSTSGGLSIYNGNVSLGTSDTQPSTTSGAYPGVSVPIYNASGSSWSAGEVIIASATATTSGYGSSAAILATTTVLGVAAETIANGAVGLMKVSGYAIIKSTGYLRIGNIVVTSNTVSGQGYAGLTTGTQVVGTEIGTIMSDGNENTHLILLSR